MCLLISQDQSQNERNLNKWFGSRTKFAYVYKVLRKQKDESFYRSAIYDRFIWDFRIQKIFKVNRPSKPTKQELEESTILDSYFDYGAIQEGLHVYTNLYTAKLYSNSPFRKIVKFRVKKEDIVAVSNFCNEGVCTELEFVKIIEG